MGCLNSAGKFDHWFGNVHLSGPCNRSCYFCIGQHMMALDALDTLDTWPLPGIDEFIEACRRRGVQEVNVTGTNTEPLLYRHTKPLTDYLRGRMPGVQLGVRTNGALSNRLHLLRHYDKFSVTVCSLTNTDVNERMMGGPAPDMVEIISATRRAGIDLQDIKVNIVLGPENIDELGSTIIEFAHLGIRRVNVREPYGQPRVGFERVCLTWGKPDHYVYGQPTWRIMGTEVTYWDVHYCEVESVNLYANGRVSEDYPITRGHDPSGQVLSQIHFPGGRIRDQWQGRTK